MDLQNASSATIVLHSIVSDRRTHLIALSVIVGPQLWTYHVPHHDEAVGLVENGMAFGRLTDSTN